MAVTQRGRRSTFGWVFVGVGVLVFLGLALAATIVAVVQHQQDAWPRTPAVVVDHESRTSTSRDRDGYSTTSITHAAVYEYTVDGRTYRSASSFSSSNPPAIGSPVTIAYDPAAPERFAVPGELSWVPWMLGGMGAFFLVIFGGVGLLVTRMGSPRPIVPISAVHISSAPIMMTPDLEPERPGRASFPAYRPEAPDGGITDGANDPDEIDRREMR